MRFNEHSSLRGKHALLSPSQGAWIDKTDEEFDQWYISSAMAAEIGTELHDMARVHIKHKIPMPDDGSTISMYVNDAIEGKMHPEQELYYSYNCFGTADAIEFYDEERLLKIYDLKTGVHTANIRQLVIYAALFCLEYDVDPKTIDVELRIYQNSKVVVSYPQADDIIFYMQRIVERSARAAELRSST